MKGEIRHRSVSWGRCITAPKVEVITVNEVLRAVLEGKIGDVDFIPLLKAVRKGKKGVKRRLPYFLASGTFKERKNDAWQSPSGLCVVDIDKADVSQLFTIKSLLVEKLPEVFCAFISPSGKGVKVLCVIPQDKEQFRLYVRNCMLRIAALLKLYNLQGEVDLSGDDPARACFFSCDPEIAVNNNAKALTQCIKVSKEVIKKITEKIEETIKEYGTPREGNRNNILFYLGRRLAHYLNRRDLETFIRFINSLFPEPLDLEHSTQDKHLLKNILKVYQEKKEQSKEIVEGKKLHEQVIALYNFLQEKGWQIKRHYIDSKLMVYNPANPELGWIYLTNHETKKDVKRQAVFFLSQMGITASQKIISFIFDSNSLKYSIYNPLQDYLKRFKPVDHGLEKFFYNMLSDVYDEKERGTLVYLMKRYFVLCYKQIIGEGQNNAMLILIGRQQIGKTKFFHRILPSEYLTIANYFPTEVQKREFKLKLLDSIIVMFDDCIETWTNREWMEIKSMVTAPIIEYQPKYSNQAYRRNRMASLAATTNYRNFLIEQENKRYICLECHKIAWQRLLHEKFGKM